MLTKLQHDKYGECELVRIEGVDWIVRSCASGQLYRVPLSRRRDFIPIDFSGDREQKNELTETKMALMTRLRAEGRWNEADMFRKETRVRLRAEGMTRRQARDAAWRLTAEKYPPGDSTTTTNVRSLTNTTEAPEAGCAGSSTVTQTAADLNNDMDTQRGDDGVRGLLRAIRKKNGPIEFIHRSHPVVDHLLSTLPQPRAPEGEGDTSVAARTDFIPGHAMSRVAESEVATIFSAAESLASAKPLNLEQGSVCVTDGARDSEKRRLRKVFKSLGDGLNPIQFDSRPFAVGIEGVQKKVENLLVDVAAEGGRSVVIRGAYGQGKTFCLQLLKQMALEADYVVASTEIGAFENQLEKPHFIYRSLMHSLSFPDTGIGGARGLVHRTQERLRSALDIEHGEQRRAMEARRILEKETQCRPLAWLLSGLTSCEKPELVGLLACQPGVSASIARRAHILGGASRDWPAFSAGTQGDFGSYVLSGISRLSRFLGYRGLIIILDEMDKWQDLDWKAQCRAGNLLGGLIWAAGAEQGSRQCKTHFQSCDHSQLITHSARCRGYPFSTIDRCHLGLAIAMTPRGDEGPESLWSNYGLLEIADLSPFAPLHLDDYIRKVFPAYCRAYDIESAMPSGLPAMAIKSWRLRGDGSTRLAVQSVLSVLDDWRQTRMALSGFRLRAA